MEWGVQNICGDLSELDERQLHNFQLSTFNSRGRLELVLYLREIHEGGYRLCVFEDQLNPDGFHLVRVLVENIRAR